MLENAALQRVQSLATDASKYTGQCFWEALNAGDGALIVHKLVR